jgi:hypothetical protein
LTEETFSSVDEEPDFGKNSDNLLGVFVSNDNIVAVYPVITDSGSTAGDSRDCLSDKSGKDNAFDGKTAS